MKNWIKFSFAYLIAFCVLPLSNLTAQSTTTLSEISEKKRSEALKRQELKRQLANPKPANPKSIADAPTNRSNGSSKVNVEQMQKAIDTKKAALKEAQSKKSLSVEEMARLKKAIEKDEKALKEQKAKKTLRVVESN